MKKCVSQFIASDCTMSMNPDSFWKSWDPMFENTADNDNQVLVSGVYFAVTEDFGSKNMELFLCGMENCRHLRFNHLYHRNPKRGDYCNSHDNLVAIVHSCVFFGIKHIPHQLLKDYPTWNDEEPGKISWDNIKKHRPIGLPQPKDWALVKLGAHKTPNWLEVVWLAVSFYVSIFFQKPLQHDSERILTWLRARIVLKQARFMTGTKRRVLLHTADAFKTFIETSGLQPLRNFYRPEHPNHEDLKW